LVWLLPGPPVPALNGSDILGVLLLAIVPGLLALLLYYFGLRGTTASAATLAELAFSPDGRKAQLRRVRNHADLEPGAGAVLLAGTITVMSCCPGCGRSHWSLDKVPSLAGERLIRTPCLGRLLAVH
jgi:hypothetical protein